MSHFDTATETTFIITCGAMVVVDTDGQCVRGFDGRDDDDSDYCGNSAQFLLCSSEEEADAVVAQLPVADYVVMSADEWQQRTGCDYLADRIYTMLESQQ